jgi:hypothetical protein
VLLVVVVPSVGVLVAVAVVLVVSFSYVINGASLLLRNKYMNVGNDNDERV